MNMIKDKKIQLPPISSLAPDMPYFAIKLPNNIVENKHITVIPESNHPKSSLFTPHEDVEILKTMRMFFGQEFNNRIPWSFWQVYRRATGSTRSDSSLYHHWNGAMKKKYGSFLTEKRLEDCIKWAETALELENARLSYDNQRTNPHPLLRTKSHQAIPPEFCPSQQIGYNGIVYTNIPQQRQLVHFPSYTETPQIHP